MVAHEGSTAVSDVRPHKTAWQYLAEYVGIALVIILAWMVVGCTVYPMVCECTMRRRDVRD